MRSIVYAGHDFKDLCSAEVIGRSALPIEAECMTIPGRAGALLVSGNIPPVDVTVRLFMDAGFKPGWERMAEMRAQLRSWLCVPRGGELVLPEYPNLGYFDALLVDSSDWSNLFETGECTLTFRLFDPVGYGMERAERTDSFEVGGTWITYPSFKLVASAGASVQVECSGKVLCVEHAFAGGEVVIIDCGTESFLIDGVDARSEVTLGSDFFALEPGSCELNFVGCSSHVTTFRERWL